jgi:hypothetical protein
MKRILTISQSKVHIQEIYRLTNKQDTFLRLVKILSASLLREGYNCRGINDLATVILDVGSYDEDDKGDLNTIGYWYKVNKNVLSHGKQYKSTFDIKSYTRCPERKEEKNTTYSVQM